MCLHAAIPKRVSRMSSMRHATLLLIVLVFPPLFATGALSRTWYVTVDGSGDVPTIQAAIDTAAPGDEILVAPGRYTWENQGGDEIALLVVYRGCNGFTLRSEAGPEATILDAQARGRVMFIQGYNHITVDGFTITGGQAPASSDYVGGGICVHISTDDVIRNCVFTDNWGIYGGGFWATSRCNTRLENCTFFGNSAERYGGGIGVGYNQVLLTVTGCTVIGNSAGQYGGGIAAIQSTMIVEHTVVMGNEAGNMGGGLCATDTEALTVTGTTFSENRAPLGGGVYARGTSSLVLTRSIVAFAREGAGVVVEPTAAVQLGCTDVFGNMGGDAIPASVIDLGGNFSADPLFCGAPGSWDMTLHADSPCLPGFHPGGAECGLIGARGAGCGSVPVTPATWGRIKKAYSR